jgi:hypothetical protein
MKRRIGLVGLVAAVGLWTGADLLACGDKFLVVGRGTRYERPKNARAASILIYTNPSTGLEAALHKLPVESLLKREGHHSTTVDAPEQLSTILASGHFDVVLAASADTAAVEELLGGAPDAPIVLSVCTKGAGQEKPAAGKSSRCALKAPPKEYSLLEAIDNAVERRDQNARKAQIRS